MNRQPRAHECIRKVNKLLAPRNARLVGAMYLKGTPARIFVAVERLGPAKRGTPVLLAANFCPFCGAALAEAGS